MVTDLYNELDENFDPIAPAFTPNAIRWEARDKTLIFKEEPLESVLAFHLGLITGRPLHFLLRSRHIGRRPDVLAVDEEGRFHIFEVKMAGKAGKGSAKQLLKYVEKVDRLVRYARRPESGKSVFGGELSESTVVLEYLLGALVGARIANRDAENLTDKVRRCGFDPEAEGRRLESAARAIHGRLGAERARGLELLDGETPQVVCWLVAPHITSSARRLLEEAAAPCPELHVLELEIARLPPRQWVVRRGTETVLPARL